MRGVTVASIARYWQIKISTHTPHARRDFSTSIIALIAGAFLLTRLMRGVTERIGVPSADLQISTHTPHARRDRAVYELRQLSVISTHTPHARRDLGDAELRI